jgi:phage minor structural protein
MIPVLYTQSETTFKNNGIGRLTDCISCEVTEERNGIYECEFQYPVTGAHYDDIQVGYIIYCMVAENGDKQPFDIYKKSVPIDGIVTFNARHISYRLVNAIVAPFSVSDVTAEQALNALKSNSITEAPFTFHSDKSGTTKYEVKEPASIRAMMGGTEGSILDVYGTGEYYFNLFDVYFYLHRGTDTDVEIRYGKNMIDFENEVDYSQMYNAVVPYWVNSETGAIVTLPEKIVKSSGATPYSDYWTNENNVEIATENGDWFEFVYTLLQAVPMDLSDQFEETPTEAQLRERATTLLENSEAWKPVDNVSVDFVQLWQTPEYDNYAPLQRLRLCDTAKVIYTDAGINARMKVIKTVFDSLLERYSSMELGDAKQSFADVITANTEDQLAKTFPNFDELTSAIQYATNMITGGNGGYLVINRNDAGQPNELLIMDNPDRTKAVNVWRFNSGGLGHSHNGYDGPFSDVALTMDGKINADMITTGTLSANRIRGGVIQSLTENGTSLNLQTGTLLTVGSDGSRVQINNGAIYISNANTNQYDGVLFSARYNGDAVQGKLYGITLRALNGYLGLGYEDEGGSGKVPLLINNGLNPNGYTESILVFGRARFTDRAVFRDAWIQGDAESSGLLINTGNSESGRVLFRAYITDVLAIDNGYYGHAGTARYLQDKFYFGDTLVQRKTYSTNFVAIALPNDYFVVGNFSPTSIDYKCHFESVYVRGTLSAQTVTQRSDEHLKNIEGYEPAYDAVLDELEPVCFTWKDPEDTAQHVGLGARRTKAILEKHGLSNSGLVRVDDDGTHGIQYNELTAMLLKRVQDQQKTINDLTARLERLEALFDANT